MAPPRRYAPPIEQLVLLLRDARERGLTFPEAWAEALRPDLPIVMSNARSAPVTALRWPTDKTEREAWRDALSSSKETWERAYEERPVTRSEAALVLLWRELAGEESTEPMRRGRGIGHVSAVA